MNIEKARHIVNQHFTDAAPDSSDEELVRATQTLIKTYGSATDASDEVKASASTLSFWNRISTLPKDIQNYIFMEKLAASKADVIRQLDSERAQRQVALITIEEELIGEYVDSIVTEIMEEGKNAPEAIENVVGETLKLRSVTLGFDEETNLQLWSEAGERRTSKAELCQELVKERLEQISAEDEIDAQLTEMIKNSEDIESDLSEMRNNIDNLMDTMDRHVFKRERQN